METLHIDFTEEEEEERPVLLGMWVFQLDLFCEVLDNVCSSLENNEDEVINETFVNIKNLMSDQCNTQKKLVSCLWNLEKTF